MISKPLQFVRTGKITMRCEPYLIIRYPTHYNALYGPITDRVTLGHYPDKEKAIAACNTHAQEKAEPA